MKTGKDRIVIVLPRMGIVIKLPVIHFFLAITEPISFSIFLGKGMWKYLKGFLIKPVHVYGGVKRFLFRGIVMNWNEFIFFRRTHNQFLQPTYFSLFGFLNIQKYGQPYEDQGRKMWSQLRELTEGNVYDDAHHFNNPANFCLYQGKLRMLDYGGSNTQKIVARYGEKIHGSFDPKKN